MSFACLGMGVGTTQPIAVGHAYLLSRRGIKVESTPITRADVPHELERLENALDSTRETLESIRDQIPDDTPIEVAEFIDTHLLMLADTALVDTTRALIVDELKTAEKALQTQRDSLVRVFDEMEDPYLRTRRDDIDHVVNQILLSLCSADTPVREDETDLAGAIIVAEDLTPADAILLHHRGAAGFVTEYGGPMSHTAILARSFNVPTVMAVHNATRYLAHGETLIVNAGTGTVLASPTKAILAHYQDRLRDAQARQDRLRDLLKRPCATRDAVPIQLLANLELPEDVAAARANGAAGVGLYRTEYLFMNRDSLPDEEEHLETYRQVIRGLDGITLTIRTLDLGLDKQIDGGQPSCPPVCNPALGLRAIRLCLKEPELFRPQVRAILRASVDGPVRMMLPMISGVGELATVLTLIEGIKRELKRDGLNYDPTLPIGGMIEVPAAALSAYALAKKLDFLSIGTNDLIQYTLAIDRIDDSVSYLYDPLHPAILRLIRMTIEAGRRANIPVGMCGEMAGDPQFTRLLIGMGLREFSMQPGSLLEIREIVCGSDCGALTDRVNRLFDRLDEDSPTAAVQAINGVVPSPGAK